MPQKSVNVVKFVFLTPGNSLAVLHHLKLRCVLLTNKNLRLKL